MKSKLPSIAVAFELKTRRVGRLMKKMCPKKQMNCIGKYRRNLINLDETVNYFYFDKLVFLVELIFMSVSTNWEEAMGPEAIFWMLNSIVFAQSVIQTILQCLILSCSIGELDGKDVNNNNELNFYVSKPRVLEPRRSDYLVVEKSLGARRRLKGNKRGNRLAKVPQIKVSPKRNRLTKVHQLTSRAIVSTLPPIEEIDRRLIY